MNMPIFFGIVGFISSFLCAAGVLFLLSHFIDFVEFSWMLVFWLTVIPTAVLAIGAMDNW